MSFAYENKLYGCITTTKSGWSRMILGASYDRKENMRSLTLELIFVTIGIGWNKTEIERI